MFEKIITFLESQELKYRLLEGGNIAVFGISGRFGTFSCIVDTQESDLFVFYSICDILTPQETRPKMAEFLTKLNHNRAIGNFEMDYTDGEIRYKTSSYYLENTLLPEEIIEKIIFTNIFSMDATLSEMENVMLGKTEIDDAITKISNIMNNVNQ